jgi:hypothetical protein
MTSDTSISGVNLYPTSKPIPNLFVNKYCIPVDNSAIKHVARFIGTNSKPELSGSKLMREHPKNNFPFKFIFLLTLLL